MDEQNVAPRSVDLQYAPRSGWLWKFVALILGAPPLAVYGGEDEIEQERRTSAQQKR